MSFEWCSRCFTAPEFPPISVSLFLVAFMSASSLRNIFFVSSSSSLRFLIYAYVGALDAWGIVFTSTSIYLRLFSASKSSLVTLAMAADFSLIVKPSRFLRVFLEFSICVVKSCSNELNISEIWRRTASLYYKYLITPIEILFYVDIHPLISTTSEYYLLL